VANRVVNGSLLTGFVAGARLLMEIRSELVSRERRQQRTGNEIMIPVLGSLFSVVRC
jgi:hypothetical protein